MVLRAALLLLAGFALMGQAPDREESIFDKPLQIFRGPAGPYEVILTVQPQKPRVGTVHFAATVLHPGTQTLVENANVLIVAYNPDGEPTYQTPALNDPATPIHYKGNIIFRGAGQWSLAVRIDSDLHGAAEARMPLHIAQPASTPGIEGALMLGLVTVALGGGAAYVAYSARRARRAGAGHGAASEGAERGA